MSPQKYIIYCLYVDDLNYIGVTRQKLKCRFKSHINHYKKWKINNKFNKCESIILFKYAEEKNKQVSMKIIDTLKSSKKLALAVERIYQIKINCVNTHILTFNDPLIEKKWVRLMFRKEHPDLLKAQKHKSYEKNKVSILKKQKEYVEKNRDKVLQRKRDYTARTKEQKKKYDKEYRKIKITCEICGIITSKHHLSTHKKSKKCLSFTS